MPLSDVKIIRQLGSGIVGFTVFLIVIFGLWFWSNASSMPAHLGSHLAQQRRVASVQQTVNQTVQQRGSAPVVLDDVHSVTESADPKLETISVACRNKSTITRHSIAQLVRIEIQKCQGSSARLQGSQIVNLANGNEGTLFKLGNGKITSDYIRLANGKNHLKIRVRTMGGRSYASDLTIVKRPGNSALHSGS